jgi:hypothetical protein
MYQSVRVVITIGILQVNIDRLRLTVMLWLESAIRTLPCLYISSINTIKPKSRRRSLYNPTTGTRLPLVEKPTPRFKFFLSVSTRYVSIKLPHQRSISIPPSLSHFHSPSDPHHFRFQALSFSTFKLFKIYPPQKKNPLLPKFQEKNLSRTQN